MSHSVTYTQQLSVLFDLSVFPERFVGARKNTMQELVKHQEVVFVILLYNFLFPMDFSSVLSQSNSILHLLLTMAFLMSCQGEKSIL